MKKDIFWNSIGTAAWSFLSLVLLIIVTRINGIADSGLFSFAFAFAIIMFTIACYGGRAYQVSDHKNSFISDVYISLRITTSFAVLVVTLFFVFINGYDLQKSLLIFLLVGQRVFDATADVFYGIMQRNHRLYISGRSLFYKSLLSLTAFLLIDCLTKNLLLSALTLPIISMLFVLFYDIPQSRKLENFQVKLTFIEMNKILTSIFLPFTITVMGLVFANIARYFIDIHHPELQGYFGIIIMPLSLIILLFSFISTPAILHLSNKYNNQEYRALHKSIEKITSIMFVATILLGIATYYIGVPVLGILFNIDFIDYIFDIILVILVGLALSLTSLFTTIAIIARRFRFTASVYLGANILLIVLCVLLVEKYGIRGAIISYIIASMAQTLVMSIYYKHLTSHKLSKNS